MWASVPAILKDAFANWIKHNDARAGAALAYYSVFSMGPILVIAIAIAGLVFGQDAVHDDLRQAMQSTIGNAGAEAVQAILASASQPHDGILATILGLGALLFAAVGVVVQLKDSLNTVWEIDETKKAGMLVFFRSYIVSLAGVLAVGFLLLVSLSLTTALSLLGKYLGPRFPEITLHIFDSVVSVVVVALLFAMMFKWLPDAEIEWADVGFGALVTSILFAIGKILIGFYIGKQGLESTFGAAASIIVVLIWVYYTAQILLFGAELTRAYALKHGSRRV